MKWFVASDIHGSAFYLGKMFERFEEEKADRILLLGDLLYHGPRNDLPEKYGPKDAITMLNEHSEKIICVRGNCDSEVDQMVLDFQIGADYAIIDIGKNIIFATHGHLYNEEHFTKMPKGTVLLNGHTHVAAFREHGDYYYMNPGSVSIPKGGSYNGYMTIEDGKYTWKDLLNGKIYREISL